QSDIKALSKYQTSIDEEILGKATMEFYPTAGEIYQKRVNEVMAIYKDILAKPFDFSVNESVQLDGDKIDYPADENARKEVWRKRLKFMTLERFADLQQQREKADKKDTSLNKTDTQFEKDARARVLSALDRN